LRFFSLHSMQGAQVVCRLFACLNNVHRQFYLVAGRLSYFASLETRLKARDQFFHALVAFRKLFCRAVCEGQDGFYGLGLVCESRCHENHCCDSGFNAPSSKLP
jgi:hypothetical protein